MEDYERILLKTNALHREYNPNIPFQRGSKGPKWKNILSPIWHGSKKVEEEGVVVIPSDPNAL